MAAGLAEYDKTVAYAAPDNSLIAEKCCFTDERFVFSSF